MTESASPRTRSVGSSREQRLAKELEQAHQEIDVLRQRNELMMEHYARTWAHQMGSFQGRWTTFEERVAVVEFVERWAASMDVSRLRILGWLGVSESKFFNWKRQVMERETFADAPHPRSMMDDEDIAAQ